MTLTPSSTSLVTTRFGSYMMCRFEIPSLHLADSVEIRIFRQIKIVEFVMATLHNRLVLGTFRKIPNCGWKMDFSDKILFWENRSFL